MKVLTKGFPHTWSGGTGASNQDSDLDHVIASGHLEFEPVTDELLSPAEVSVRGWPQIGAAEERDTWITQHSDHALLFFQIRAPS